MTDKAKYQALPLPHGRVRPASPLIVQEGRLPPDLMEHARSRQAEAEVLVLPREADERLKDGDPSLAIYNDSDMVFVDVLRRGGVRADFLTDHRKVVAQFSTAVWIEFAVLVSAGITVEIVIALARYLAGRIREARESRTEEPLDLTLSRPDGTFVRATGTDTDTVPKAFYATGRRPSHRSRPHTSDLHAMPAWPGGVGQQRREAAPTGRW